MKKKVAILQSNYIPWKGYFDLINSVDEFIIYDEMQYTKRDWRNRNKIKTKDGVTWLSIPVEVKGKFSQKINETKVSDPNWHLDHWKTIKMAYAKAEHFKAYSDLFEDVYVRQLQGVVYLSQINLLLINKINQLLDIKTKITLDHNLGVIDGKTERLLDLCKKCDANIYLSGPAAKDYLQEDLFTAENINVEWMNYSGYQEYKQMHPPFEHAVTVLDLIFNLGPDAKHFMKTFNNPAIRQVEQAGP